MAAGFSSLVVPKSGAPFTIKLWFDLPRDDFCHPCRTSTNAAVCLAFAVSVSTDAERSP